jgi:hypothetical protein
MGEKYLLFVAILRVKNKIYILKEFIPTDTSIGTLEIKNQSIN